MSKSISREENFTYLTIALILLLLLSSVLEQFANQAGQHYISGSLIVVLAIGVWSFRAEKKTLKIGIGLVFAVLIVSILNALFDQAGLHNLHLVFVLVYLISTTWLAAKQVLFSGRIDGNTIVGSICIFLLLGLVWAMLYLLLLSIDPTSFNGVAEADWYDNFSQLVYYSFVTLSTLGYGEITPKLPVARFLAYAEAITGQFYMAILVASLVGARLSRGSHKG